MIKEEKHQDGTWNTSRYHYKDRLLLVKSRRNRGMKCHIFHPNSDTEIDFTMRWRFITVSKLLNTVKTKIDKRG
jgi:hypothetical protein